MIQGLIEKSAKGVLEIENNVVIRPFAVVICKDRIEIGEGTQIASGAQIIDHDHKLEPLEAIAELGECAPVRIGKYCWIGANAVILKGVTLGDYCVVGAGAIVTKSFSERSIIVGNPARLLKTR